MRKNYLSELGLKMEMKKEMNEQPAALSVYTGLGAAITAELMIGFWFGIGVLLATGIVDSLNHFVGALTRGK